MKRLYFLATLVAAVLCLSSGCGTSDYLQSVQLTATGASSGGFFNLAGIDGTLQLNATAVYHSGKGVNVTSSVTYTVTTFGTDASGNPLPAYGPTTVPINPSGLMTAEIPLCTWTDVGTPVPTPPQYNWEYTGYYSVVANYRGMQTQPVAIGVGSAQGDAPDGSCGPK